MRAETRAVLLSARRQTRAGGLIRFENINNNTSPRLPFQKTGKFSLEKICASKYAKAQT